MYNREENLNQFYKKLASQVKFKKSAVNDSREPMDNFIDDTIMYYKDLIQNPQGIVDEVGVIPFSGEPCPLYKDNDQGVLFCLIPSKNNIIIWKAIDEYEGEEAQKFFTKVRKSFSKISDTTVVDSYRGEGCMIGFNSQTFELIEIWPDSDIITLYKQTM